MDINNWSFYHKILETTFERETTQMVYEPRINQEKDVFCMNFCYPSQYQLKQRKTYPEYYTEELVENMFFREKKYLLHCSKFKWAPEILEIDDVKRQIFFKWYDNTCNEILYGDHRNKNLIDLCKIKFQEIIKEQLKNQIYKLSAYPHCYYLDNNLEMRTFDFYACCTEKETFINLNDIRGLLGDSSYRFLECTDNDFVNLKLMFVNTMTKYSFWPDNLTREIYEKFYR